LILIGAGVWMLVGCIYIPTFNATTEGRNHSGKVGDANSRKPIRVGQTHRDDVMRLLGPPPFVTPDGRGAVYPWRATRGVWVMPLCFMVESMHSYHGVFLTFDERGYLERFQFDSGGEDDLFHGADPGELTRGLRPWGRWNWPDEPDRIVPKRSRK
jgi:hypothetical protein